MAGPNSGLVVWDPVTGKHFAIRAGGGIPSDQVYRLEVDTMVDPPALHVATAGGAARDPADSEVKGLAAGRCTQCTM